MWTLEKLNERRKIEENGKNRKVTKQPTKKKFNILKAGLSFVLDSSNVCKSKFAGKLEDLKKVLKGCNSIQTHDYSDTGTLPTEL